MKISVIIPCYNVEAFIAECIDSVLRQTYEDTEVLCIDNNSSDRTWEILSSYAEKYPQKIRIARETKQGAPAARNLGISLSAGEWLQFLDADDILKPGKITHQVELIRTLKPEPDVIVAAIQKKYVDNRIVDIELYTQDIWRSMIKGRAGSTCSNLYRKKAVAEAGGWDENKRSSQEAYFLFEILKKKKQIVFDTLPLTLVRERLQGSITSTDKAGNWERYIQLRIEIWEYLKKEGLLTNEVETSLKQSLFDSIRSLYTLDANKALEIYDKVVKGKFTPIASAVTSPLYLAFYRLLGFKSIQQLKSKLR